MGDNLPSDDLREDACRGPTHAGVKQRRRHKRSEPDPDQAVVGEPSASAQADTHVLNLDAIQSQDRLHSQLVANLERRQVCRSAVSV